MNISFTLLLRNEVMPVLSYLPETREFLKLVEKTVLCIEWQSWGIVYGFVTGGFLVGVLREVLE